MDTYIALLRGINVSGQKLIKMDALRDLFINTGFQNVETYIQSGNIIFNYTKTEQKTLSKHIENRIHDNFGFEVPVIIRTLDDFKKIINRNPYPREDKIYFDTLHITFLSETPAKENIIYAEEFNFEPDSFIVAEKEVYVYCPNGYGNTKISNNFFESKLKVKATTRKLRTVKELIKIAGTV